MLLRTPFFWISRRFNPLLVSQTKLPKPSEPPLNRRSIVRAYVAPKVYSLGRGSGQTVILIRRKNDLLKKPSMVER